MRLGASLVAQGKASARSAGGPGSIPGSGRSLEKEMATHSGTLALQIPCMEKPVGYSPQAVGYKSMRSQRVGRD